MIKRSKAVILFGGRVLLGLDSKDLVWGLPGGHLEDGEYPIDALLREIYEETGIQLSSRDAIIDKGPVGDSQVYLVHLDTLGKLCIDNDPDSEFIHLDFFALNHLPVLRETNEELIYSALRGHEVSSKVVVLVDNEVYTELPDDEIWQTMPRLAQLRSQGKKIRYIQTLPNGEVIDFQTDGLKTLHYED